ncbi:Holliday junction branch migration protein RuvA [Parachlamydia sp. AcF125]|uniref:Holliday junction branch migration protein RuvA n=1 Tax=Parachlamydia sp. AcF125 TaxID=2795736 RepID=UPI001BC97548|nr:Holliday junction branch migration protein RuvA [Parachlamydia sp. AcF125]MBS4167609.1 Holliday junction ATP-dependent DNA helicase RuvA [Parachlamydia sp. AcF125]
MYDYLKGVLIAASPTSVVIEAGGIGYKIFIPTSTFGKLAAIGQSVKLYISFVIREQSHTLFGFFSAEERELFETLLTVSGIGPKTAVALIGYLSSTQLSAAIYSHDITALSKVPGVGKKTAERLIVELKDKLTKTGVHPAVEAVAASPLSEKSQTIVDALNALIHLGYNQAVAKQAIQKTLKEYSPDIDLATLITATLKHI